MEFTEYLYLYVIYIILLIYQLKSTNIKDFHTLRNSFFYNKNILFFKSSLFFYDAVEEFEISYLTIYKYQHLNTDYTDYHILIC